MKRKTAKFLLILELLCAVTAFGYCLKLYYAGSELTDTASVENTALTLEKYADVIDDHLKSIDMAGEVLPAWGTTLRECAAVLDGEVLKFTRQAERIASGGNAEDEMLLSILVAAEQKRVRSLAAALNRTIPALVKSLEASAGMLEGHGIEEHRRTMEAVEMTGVNLRLLAVDLREGAAEFTAGLRFILVFGTFTSLALVMNAAVCFIMLCTGNQSSQKS
ncbi:MAG: hypothetical protein J6S21_01835 [Victivallales bacterium]|nr:hypothetical protein [Victivallales bacterium]